MSSKKLQNEVKKLNSNATIYKGHTMQGDYGWIMRTMRGESFLGKNLSDAFEHVHNLVVENEQQAADYLTSQHYVPVNTSELLIVKRVAEIEVAQAERRAARKAEFGW